MDSLSKLETNLTAKQFATLINWLEKKPKISMLSGRKA